MIKFNKDIIINAIKNDTASSIALFISHHDHDITHHAGFINEKASDDHSIYDLASLTKIIGTTMALALAIDKNLIKLSDKPFSCWPDVSLQDLLTHSSGLKAHYAFYEHDLSHHDFAANYIAIKNILFSQPVSHDKTRVYSDLGFLALGFLLEDLFHKSLWDIFILSWQAFGIDNFIYFPSGHNIKNHLFIAPTFCPQRQAKLIGQVHDYNAWLLGGLGGHAGLFGDLLMLKSFSKKLLAMYHDPHNNLEKILQYFMKHHLGFAMNTNHGSNACLSPRSYGHFGYTGVSLWLDPAISLIIILLTNRVFKKDDPHAIFALRKSVNQEILRKL